MLFAITISLIYNIREVTALHNLRYLLLKQLLGKNITIFVDELKPYIKPNVKNQEVRRPYAITIADDKKRLKIMVLKIEKITPVRYHLKGYLPF
jgi:hypothetical protein